MAKIGRPSACVDELAKAHLRRCVEEKLNIVGTDIDNAMPQIQKFVKEALKEDTDEKEKNDEEVISLDAIRRCWGVKEGKVGKNKLSIIAKAIGYDGWDDFVLRYKDKDPIPMFIGFGRFSAARYNPGDIIALGVPQKYIILRCIDEFTFEIIKKTNITTKEESTVLSPSMFLRELSVLPSQDGNSYTPTITLVRGNDEEEDIIL